MNKLIAQAFLVVYDRLPQKLL